MKYEEKLYRFVTCQQVDSNNKCGSKTVDGVCVDCIEYYEQLKDDIIDDFIYENKDKKGFPKRELWDFVEVSREPNDYEEFLRFGLWSEAV
jgi:hypothetical protein